MAKRMLIDSTHPEETRVVVLNGNRLEEFDFETSIKKQIKGNIYLAKVTRVEPSLQAAFVDYGGNRHGFLAFSEIHPDYYRIPVSDRERDRDYPPRHSVEAEAEIEAESAHGPDDPPMSHPQDEIGAHFHEGDSEPAADLPNGFTDEAEPHIEEEPPSPASAEARIDTPTLRDDGPAESAPDWLPTAEPRSLSGEASGGAESQGSKGHATEDQIPEDRVLYKEGELELVSNGPEVVAELASPAPADPQVASAELAEPPAPVGPETTGGDSMEVLGGDEMEEASRQRARRHRPYKIQEVIKRRQIMLVQVTKEERGNKGAALTTYLSLAGRYCVLMPNTDRGGGVSRKITNTADRRRLKELLDDLQVPDGMGVIVRTAGSERSKAEIKRDFEYLIRLWDEIREHTLKSTAPALIYEEGNLIKRSIRDLYARDIEEVIVEGEEGYKAARTFMKMLMPSHAKRVHYYRDPTVPLFHRFQVESQIDAIHSPVVQLRSGGYIVINPTEALVSIDVNSGRSTKERNIEETALKTNVEAAEEIARQLRLRDLAGLIVIDFIDMEEHRNQVTVERRLKEAMKHDRARIQVGRISAFGLLEMSRQRLRPSLVEASTQPCPHCGGTGHVRSVESTALHVLRAIEEEGMRRRSAEISVAVPSNVALYILNQKRQMLADTEQRYHFRVTITNDDTLIPPNLRLERLRTLTPSESAALPPAVMRAPTFVEDDDEGAADEFTEETAAEVRAEETRDIEPEAAARPEHAPEHALEHAQEPRSDGSEDGNGRRRRRRRRRRRGGDEHRDTPAPSSETGEERAFAEAHALAREEIAEREAYPESPPGEAMPGSSTAGDIAPADTGYTGEGAPETTEGGDAQRKRRRRGRRGGRRRRRGNHADHGEGPAQVIRSERGGGRFYDETTNTPFPEAPVSPHEADPWRDGLTARDPQQAEAHGGQDGPEEVRAHRDHRPEPPFSEARSAEPHAEHSERPAAPESQQADAASESPAPAESPASGSTSTGSSPAGSSNVPPAITVTERPANPRRGWWHRLTQG